MSRRFRKLISSLLVLSTTFLFLAPQILNADDHVVQAGALHQAVMDAAQARLNRIETLEKFLSSETARKALREAALDQHRQNTSLDPGVASWDGAMPRPHM